MPPKRRAPSNVDLESTNKPATKRTRFADPEEDDDGRFAAEVDASLEDGGKAGRKRGFKIEGYDSDSTDDGEGVVLSRRKDDDDMFDAEQEKGKDDPGFGKKPTKFLNLGDIEGQEFDEKNDGAESGDGSDVSSSEPEDEDDAERRKKAGMGFELTKFNMKEELEEGKFADDGMYVRSFDAHAVHDRWMEGVGEREMKKARKAKRIAERKERERVRQEEASGLGSSNKVEMEKELAGLLRPSESVLEALARLGKQKKAIAKNKNASDASKDSNEAISSIDRITALASSLMANDPEIYSTTYEALLRTIRRSGAVPQDWVPPTIKYEYKWAGSDTPDTVYGPFTAEELAAWYEALFFGANGEKVVLRKVDTLEWVDWHSLFG